jgi:hypothetical protein
VNKGWGLWVATIGSIVLLLACLAVAARKREATAGVEPRAATT